MNRHHITNHMVTTEGERLFTDTGWEKTISPRIDSMPREGGCICIFLTTEPDRQNYLNVQVSVFTPDERKTIRKSILSLRKKQQAKSQ